MTIESSDFCHKVNKRKAVSTQLSAVSITSSNSTSFGNACPELIEGLRTSSQEGNQPFSVR